MKILLATPLYPPDISDPAPYVKTLALRLKDEYEVTILAYNHIPERIDGVRIETIEKRQPLLIRLIKFTRRLLRESRNADVVYIQNGASTELPLICVSLFTRTPFVLRLGDEAAIRFAQQSIVLNLIQNNAIYRSTVVVAHADDVGTYARTHTKADVHILGRPKERPEILPFEEHSAVALKEYEASWERHIEELKNILNHGA